jgi:hypothetical protein
MFTLTEKELEEDFLILKNRLNKLTSITKNKNLKYLNKKDKENEITKVLLLLNKIGNYCLAELKPLGVWDSQITKDLKNKCFKLLNKLHGFNSKYTRL